MELRERFAEMNNQDHNDDVYIPFLKGAGVTVRADKMESNSILNRANEILHERLGKLVVNHEDRILSAPPEADSWNDISVLPASV